METQSTEDFRELLESLNSRGVEYVVVGAQALAFHGAPRTTGDMDILVNPTPSNAERVLTALDDFGLGSLNLSVDDFAAEDNVVQLGVPPLRVDLLTSLTGVSWEEVSSGSVDGDFEGVPVRYIGRQDFIRNKKAIGRHKDLADIEALGQD